MPKYILSKKTFTVICIAVINLKHLIDNNLEDKVIKIITKNWKIKKIVF